MSPLPIASVTATRGSFRPFKTYSEYFDIADRLDEYAFVAQLRLDLAERFEHEGDQQPDVIDLRDEEGPVRESHEPTPQYVFQVAALNRHPHVSPALKRQALAAYDY